MVPPENSSEDRRSHSYAASHGSKSIGMRSHDAEPATIVSQKLLKPKSKDTGAQMRQPITDSGHFKSKANNNFSTVEDSLTDDDAMRPKDQT